MADNVNGATGEFAAKWYVLHTYSGYEKKVAGDIMTLVENRDLHHLIEETYVPTVMVTTTNERGQTVEIEDKVFPSYVFVKMVYTDESWYICRNTRGVTGFVGPGSQPTPLSDEEVANIFKESEATTPEISFKVGETVDCVSENFDGFQGKIVSIDADEGTAVIDVIFLGGKIVPTTVKLSEIRKI